MIYSFLTTNISQFLQYFSFLPSFGENMSNKDCFSGSKVPDMEIVDIYYSLQFGNLLLELLGVDVGWG